MNQDQIDAGFDQVRSERFLRAHAAEARDPGFWRALNPHLTISPQPWSPAAEPVRVDPAVADRAARQIVTEGYCQVPPLLSPARIAPLRLGAERVVAAGFPAGFTCVYGELYRAFQGLDALFAPLLGDRYLLVLRGLWTFLVPAGDTAYRRWTTIAPHRDLLGPDPNVIAHEPPSILSVWIPLTDVTRPIRVSTSCPRRAIRTTIRGIAASCRNASGCRTSARCRPPPDRCSDGRRISRTGAAAAAGSPPGLASRHRVLSAA